MIILCFNMNVETDELVFSFSSMDILTGSLILNG